MPVPIPANDMATSHSPAQSWSFRVPSPPRITVPPPPLNARGIPDLHVVQDSPFDFESSGFDNAEFLRTVTYGNFICSNNMLVSSHFAAVLAILLIDIALGMEVRTAQEGTENSTISISGTYGGSTGSELSSKRRYYNGLSSTQY